MIDRAKPEKLIAASAAPSRASMAFEVQEAARLAALQDLATLRLIATSLEPDGSTQAVETARMVLARASLMKAELRRLAKRLRSLRMK